MASKRILDKATKKYYKKKSRFEMPGWIISFMGLSILLAGIVTKIRAVIAVGLLVLFLGIGLVFLGKSTYLFFSKR